MKYTINFVCIKFAPNNSRLTFYIIRRMHSTGNGYIPTTCLREILRELDDQLTNEELDMMIEEIDSDGSGTVDFDGTLSIFSLTRSTKNIT